MGGREQAPADRLARTALPDGEAGMIVTSLVEFLSDPDSYPERPSAVRLVQSHISWVFIGDDFVYKVKKPVDFGFLDFSTLDKRRFYTHEELRLNRRFSPHVYVGVVPISRRGGSFLIGDDSHVAEYALVMKRLSDEHMLSRMFAAGEARPEHMERLGRHLAAVYGAIAGDEHARSFGSLATIGGNVRENFDQTRRYRGGPVPGSAFDALEVWSTGFLDNHAALFESRVAGGHIKDCHGDLHLQHICIEDDTISVFDCIEFNERFRFGDVASDVAFLAMDCDVHGRPDLGEAFVRAFVDASGDGTLGQVLTFYKVYRAYVRAKVTSFMLDDPGLDDAARDDAFDRAARYYDLAHTYVRHAH